MTKKIENHDYEKVRGFAVISNKTVRAKERFAHFYEHKDGGQLVKTNRGYFLDGKHISVFSANVWLAQYHSRCKDYIKRHRPQRSPKFCPDEIERREKRRRRFADQGWSVKAPAYDW